MYEDKSNVAFDIMPVVERSPLLKSFKTAETKYDSKINSHALFKRTEKNQILDRAITDYGMLDIRLVSLFLVIFNII